MRIIQIGTLVAVLSAMTAVLTLYKDREYIPQLVCSVISVVGEIHYCSEFVATAGEGGELAARRKREAEKEAEAAERRRRDAEQRALAAEAARQQAEEDAYAERRRKREAEKEAEEAELHRRDAEQRALAAEAARRQAEAAAIQSAMPQEYSMP